VPTGIAPGSTIRSGPGTKEVTWLPIGQTGATTPNATLAPAAASTGPHGPRGRRAPSATRHGAEIRPQARKCAAR